MGDIKMAELSKSVEIKGSTISFAAYTHPIWPNSGHLNIKIGPLEVSIRSTSERKALLQALIDCDQCLSEYEKQFEGRTFVVT